VRNFLALALFAAAIGTGFAADPDAPSVRAYAVNINHPPKEASREIVSNEYTGVYLFANIPGKKIVALDTPASKLAVTDDKGTEIFASTVRLGPSMTTDSTQAQGRLYLLSQKAPAQGATRIRVKGELVLLCGTGEKTSTVENFALKTKEKAEVGPASFEVNMPKDRAMVLLKTDSPLVKSVTFIGADGKAINVLGALTLGNNVEGKVVHFANYTLPPKLETVGIKVVHYEKIEAVKVVVDSETGVGP
jgi:hypothetical protein